ncbi:MAG: DUF4372 domain-containing protein, partial [Verrucomicrobia bacterium]|nr:DUF4372 domain-containing protein [Verrucomicrobiota bacterium]
GQRRSRPFDARGVLSVRERERREERQVCEPEGSAKWRERRWRLFSTFPNVNVSCSMCSQILKLIPRSDIQRLVNQTGAEYRSKGLSSWSQLVAMFFWAGSQDLTSC